MTLTCQLWQATVSLSSDDVVRQPFTSLGAVLRHSRGVTPNSNLAQRLLPCHGDEMEAHMLDVLNLVLFVVAVVVCYRLVDRLNLRVF